MVGAPPPAPPPPAPGLQTLCSHAGNNVTRPFRVAGAAAVAPLVDRFMLSLQQRLRLPSKAWAFALIVGAVAAASGGVVAALFVSRLVVAAV